MIGYRDAGIADAPTLSRVSRDSFTETFGHLYSPTNLGIFLDKLSPRNWAAELADSNLQVRLAEDDGIAIGFAKLGPPSLPFDSGDRRALELRQLYVLSGWQGSGVAATLMDWVVTAAKAREAQDLWLSVFTENPRARRFYARYGFVEIMPYKFMVGDHADEDILCKAVLDG